MVRSNVRICIVMIRPLAGAVLTLSLLGMGGYAFSIEALYRPLQGGAATHPLTLMIAGLIALSIFGQRVHGVTPLADLLAGFAAFSCLLRLLEPGGAMEVSPFGLPLPFADVVAADLAAGRPNAMGVNTAMMFLLIAVSVLSRRRVSPLFSQMAAFVGLAFPMVAVTGYAYGLSGFYGQMSLYTAVMGGSLAVIAALLSVHKSLLRTLLGPNISGRLARFQILLGYAFPWLMGLLMLHALEERGGLDLFGVFVVGLSWFVIFLLGVSAILHERSDHARRLVERALAYGATVDALTGIWNRRAFGEAADIEWRRAMRFGVPYALILLDLDHFKRVNDTGGHAMGDKVLRDVAAAIKRNIRVTDIPGRLGGEEFAVLLPGASWMGAAQVAENLRVEIAALSFDPWPGHDGRITVSVGYGLSEGYSSPENLYVSVDQALYRAKETGRNRVSLAAGPKIADQEKNYPHVGVA